MPEYSHSPNAVYVIYRKGVFHAMRIYGEDHMPIIEIAYHPEPNLNHGDREHGIWYMHEYEKGNLKHSRAELISNDVKKEYKDYLEDIGYDQWLSQPVLGHRMVERGCNHLLQRAHLFS